MSCMNMFNQHEMYAQERAELGWNHELNALVP